MFITPKDKYPRLISHSIRSEPAHQLPFSMKKESVNINLIHWKIPQQLPENHNLFSVRCMEFSLTAKVKSQCAKGSIYYLLSAVKILFKLYLIFQKKKKRLHKCQKKKKSRLTTKKYVYFKQPKFYFINQ